MQFLRVLMDINFCSDIDDLCPDSHGKKAKLLLMNLCMTKYLHLPKNVLGLEYKLNLIVVAYDCSYVWSLNQMKVGIYTVCGNIKIFNHCTKLNNFH
jgi:hypothetical protein